jgi:hypothetical protein
MASKPKNYNELKDKVGSNKRSGTIWVISKCGELLQQNHGFVVLFFELLASSQMW